MSYIFSGFADEAGWEIDAQIRATKELGWSNIEMRGVKVGDLPPGNLHDVSDEVFLQVVEKLGEANIRIHCFGSGLANGGRTSRTHLMPIWNQRSARRCGCRNSARNSSVS